MKIKLPWLFLLSMLVAPVLAQTSYCPASASSNYYTATSNITLGTINNNPTVGYSNYPGYTDHSSMSADAPVGGTLPFSVNVGRYSFTTSYFKIFADFNGDGVFSPNELAYSKGPTPDTSVSGNIAIPENAMIGKIRIRVMQSPYNFSNACGSIGNYGEVDDYSLNITKTSYCHAQANYTYYAGISNVVLGQINNSITNTPTPTNPYPAYGDFTSLSTTANPGGSVPISVTSGAPAGATSYIAVYADFNNNGIFENNELSFSTSWKALNNFTSKTVSGAINLPDTAHSGNVRIRVIQSLDPIKRPCGDMGNNGEVEDYTLVIRCNAPKPSANTVSYCGPSNATVSANNPVPTFNYSWHTSLLGGSQLSTGTNYSAFTNTSTVVYLQAQNQQGCFSERTPVNININSCCSTNTYKVESTYQTFSKNGDLVFYVTNNQSTSQTFTVSIPSGIANNYASTSTSKSVTLSAGQSTTIVFSGSHPISSGTYNQSITIKDSKCTLSYSIPIKVDTSLSLDAYFEKFSVGPNPFTTSLTITNIGTRSSSYAVYAPNGHRIATGTSPVGGRLTIQTSSFQCTFGCGLGEYSVYIDLGGLGKTYKITRR